MAHIDVTQHLPLPVAGMHMGIVAALRKPKVASWVPGGPANPPLGRPKPPNPQGQKKSSAYVA